MCNCVLVQSSKRPRMPTSSGIDYKRMLRRVSQSDSSFRLLARRYGTSVWYSDLLSLEWLEYHIRGLGSGVDLGNLERPVMAQLCGNDPDIIVQVGRNLQEYNGFCQCDARSIGRGELKKKSCTWVTWQTSTWFFFSSRKVQPTLRYQWLHTKICFCHNLK